MSLTLIKTLLVLTPLLAFFALMCLVYVEKQIRDEDQDDFL